MYICLSIYTEEERQIPDNVNHDVPTCLFVYQSIRIEERQRLDNSYDEILHFKNTDNLLIKIWNCNIVDEKNDILCCNRFGPM